MVRIDSENRRGPWTISRTSHVNRLADALSDDETQDGPTSGPTTIGTTPHSTSPRTTATMLPITRITARQPAHERNPVLTPHRFVLPDNVRSDGAGVHRHPRQRLGPPAITSRGLAPSRTGTGWRLGGDDEPLANVEAVVRRTLAARIRDRHLIEDLTQETLARLAGTEHRFSPDAERAYAVVTARNLLVSHFRRQSVRGRHLHRLLDNEGSDDPAQATLDREESDTMTSALGQLDPADRDLLMRHEVHGTDLATLAGEANVTSGAIAMRLARARANLRLEFLLAFRRMKLPTNLCRPVLLAVAVGDRRRQTQLDADEHVRSCSACAELVGPMTHRDRRIAGWLLIPVAEGLRRGWRALRSHPVPAASAALILAGTGALLVAVRSPDDEAAPATVVTPAATAPAARAVPVAARPWPRQRPVLPPLPHLRSLVRQPRRQRRQPRRPERRRRRPRQRRRRRPQRQRRHVAGATRSLTVDGAAVSRPGTARRNEPG